MKSGRLEIGLFIAGVGVGLGWVVLEQAGLEMPTWLLFVLGALALMLIGGGLVIAFLRHGNTGGSPDDSDPCGDLLRELRPAANQLTWNLHHFPNWWVAVEDKDFKGNLPDGYGPITHGQAMETLLYMFAQFFSAAWTYQSYCKTHADHGKVKALVDTAYDALGTPGDPRDLATDARIGADSLHVIAEVSTTGGEGAEGRPVRRSAFGVKLEYHANAFTPLATFLRRAGPNTAARARLKAAEEATERVVKWLDENDYGP